MKLDYNRISFVGLDGTCASFSANECERLFENSTVANKKAINKIVKEQLPDLYEDLALNLRNPYRYFKTKTHLILVYSGTDYFIRYQLV